MADKKTIGRYEIVSELGRGGMGVVFKAWEASLERFVAIKMLSDQLSTDESLVQRFLREARSVADLNHPNVVQVFAVDTFDGRPYFVMEFVEGDSLSKMIRRLHRVDKDDALRLTEEVATGLGAAHQKGVVHRDVKPDNIMLTKHGGVKVVDFGIARVDDPNTKLTATGVAVGTPNYVSPEICLGLEVDNRSDLFSLGVVLYEMLTGKTPFNADSPLEMMTNVVNAEPPDIGDINREVDSGIRMIVSHLLEKNPDLRYQNTGELIDDIRKYRAGTSPSHAELATTGRIAVTPDAAAVPTSSRRSAAMVASLLLIGGAAAAGWWFLGPAADSGNADVAEAGVDSRGTSEDPGGTAAADDHTEPPVEQSAVASDADDATASSGPDTPADEQAPDGGTETDIDSEVPEPVQVAAVQPEPEPAAAAPVDPMLVVFVSGDAAVAPTIENVIKAELGASGFDVMNERLMDGASPGAGLATLSRVSAANGADIMVIAEVIPAGERRLEYYGRSDIQRLSNLRVEAIALDERRSIGTPLQESLQYVALNAEEQARLAAEPAARALVERLQARSTDD